MSDPHRPHSYYHDVLAAVLGVLALGVLLSAPWQIDTSGPTPFYKGPLLYPLLVLALMVGAAVPSVLRLLLGWRRSVWHLDDGGFPRRPLLAFALLVGFVVLLELAGLEAACAGFLLTALLVLGERRPAVLVLVPLVTTVLVVLVFKHLLDVWFPAPVLWDWWEG